MKENQREHMWTKIEKTNEWEEKDCSWKKKKKIDKQHFDLTGKESIKLDFIKYLEIFK